MGPHQRRLFLHLRQTVRTVKKMPMAKSSQIMVVATSSLGVIIGLSFTSDLFHQYRTQGESALMQIKRRRITLHQTTDAGCGLRRVIRGRITERSSRPNTTSDCTMQPMELTMKEWA